MVADTQKIVALRKKLAWTQQEAGQNAGYSERLIRKIERQEPVRPRTLNDVVQCYHEGMGIDDWDINDFLFEHESGSQAPALNEKHCPNCRRVREYFEVVYCQRKPEKIDDYCCQNVRFTGEGSSRTGIETLHQRAAAMLGAFDPIEFKFDRIHSIDQIVYCFWDVRMKHSGDFFEIPATGRWVNLRGNSVSQFADGLVVDSEDHFDVESIIRQIQGDDPRII
jgi:predicted ester cyclase